MAHAVAIAAEPAGHPAEQVDDHENDQDQPKRHDALPSQSAPRHARLQQSIFCASAPSRKRGRPYVWPSSIGTTFSGVALGAKRRLGEQTRVKPLAHAGCDTGYFGFSFSAAELMQ